MSLAQRVRGVHRSGAGQEGAGWLDRLNTRWHELAGLCFMAVVLGHWLEHIAQAYQVYFLGLPRPASLGALGMVWPWLVTSEWMHYGYALVMLAGLILLRPGMTGRARFWWDVSLWIQVWHHFEHLLLL
ncbi:MAG: hypothetical protein R3185_06325, partial [Candidatus Thermoplasmatota archaeon]|nr:hypothetical protein [Candidatus Thermoplasmatota archaeon]